MAQVVDALRRQLLEAVEVPPGISWFIVPLR